MKHPKYWKSKKSYNKSGRKPMNKDLYQDDDGVHRFVLDHKVN